MFIDKIPAKDKENNYHVIIEIPMNSSPVKYEFNKDSGAMYVDRFMQAPMFYPCNYGFVPHSLSEDGDPADVLVVTNYALNPSTVIAVRPIGVLIMEDESGKDEKIVAVPTTKIDASFKNIASIDDIPMLKERITHFFENYKKLDSGKWVKISGWENAEMAGIILETALKKYCGA